MVLAAPFACARIGSTADERYPSSGSHMILHALNLALSLGALGAQGSVAESTLVARVQRTLASTLDASLPRISVEQWLAQIASIVPDSLLWEVNDCGEGGDGRTSPTCVEAAFDLPGGSAGSMRIYMLSRDGTVVTPAIAELLTKTGETYRAHKTVGEWLSVVRRRQGDGPPNARYSRSAGLRASPQRAAMNRSQLARSHGHLPQ